MNDQQENAVAMLEQAREANAEHYVPDWVTEQAWSGGYD